MWTARLLGGLAIAVWAAIDAAATQQMPTEPTEPQRLSLHTVPAPCELAAASLDRMEDGYKSILLAWAAGADGARELDTLWQQTVDNGAQFEVTDETVRRLPTIPSGGIIVPAIGCMERAEVQVLRRLIERAPETIPSLFAFHLEVYQLQITPPPLRRWLAARSRDRLLWLVAQHKQTVPGGPEARGQRARLLLMLADRMQTTPFLAEVEEARSVLERILKLDPGSIAARYMAATLAERVGDYDAAVRHLVRLARHLPDDQEVALRLALNRMRTGDERTGRALLEEVAREGAPDWLRIVAYQELVRQASGRRHGSGEQILRGALEAFPGDRQLTLQLAAVLVEQGLWLEAERSVQLSLAVEPDPEEISSRLRYDIPRRDELERDAALFEAEAGAGLDSLRRRLGSI